MSDNSRVILTGENGTPPNAPKNFDAIAISADNKVYAPTGRNGVLSWLLVQELGGGSVSDPLTIGAVEAGYVNVGAVPAGTPASGALTAVSGIVTTLDILDSDFLATNKLFHVSNAYFTASSAQATELDPQQDSPTWSFVPSYWDSALRQPELDILAVALDAAGAYDLQFQFYDKDFSGLSVLHINANGAVHPDDDDSGSLGTAAKSWGDIYATLPTTDPVVAGQFFTMDGAGLAAALGAGARYVLVSNGP